MLLVGYTGAGVRVHIENYSTDNVTGETIYCEEGHVLVAKKGDVRKHHFCHKNKKDGTSGQSCGSEGKTSWHIWWQARLLDKNIEFRFNKEILKIADSINLLSSFTDGPKDILSIVEFQNSKFSVQEIRLRESFYTRTDLMSQWGLPFCKAILTWVFNLADCDIEIEHIFGDIVCFRWVKGSKYMYSAQTTTYWDLGKRDLIEVYAIHKPKIMQSLIIGRLVSLEDFDKFYFQGALKSYQSAVEHTETNRLNVHKLANFTVIKDDAKRKTVVEMCHVFYFGKPLKKQNMGKKKEKATKEKERKVTKEDIENFLR